MSTGAITRLMMVMGVVIAVGSVLGLSFPKLINPSLRITEVQVNEKTVVVSILVSGARTSFGRTMYTATTSYSLPSKSTYVAVKSNVPLTTSTRALTFPVQNTPSIASTCCPTFI